MWMKAVTNTELGPSKYTQTALNEVVSSRSCSVPWRPLMFAFEMTIARVPPSGKQFIGTRRSVR